MALTRYARLQVDADSIPDDDKPPQTGHTFNIWFLKWAGGDSNSRNLSQSKFRVNIKKDSGTTKGVDGKSPICVFFARGCCYRGRKCTFLHRLPAINDTRIPTQDCFGRDKTSEYRDDMAGVGSLQRINRTIFVTGAHMNDSVQETLNRQFSEFGAVDKIRVLHAKNCAFISFRLEAEAQFAKEAMDAQTLDGKDVLSVKWANDDPNPQAQASAKRELEETAMETVKRLLESTEGENEIKKLKKMETNGFDEYSKEGNEDNVKTHKVEVAGSDKSELFDLHSEEPAGILGSGRSNALKKLHTRNEGKNKPKEGSNLGQDSIKKKEMVNGSTSSSAVTKASAFSGYSSDEDSD